MGDIEKLAIIIGKLIKKFKDEDELSNKDREKLYTSITKLQKKIISKYPSVSHNISNKKYLSKNRECEICGTTHTNGGYYKHLKTKKHLEKSTASQ